MLTRREILVAGAASAVVVGGVGVGVGLPRERFVPAGYFPNVLLETHDGRLVRFYDDLVKDKVVAINMMYANCEGICPRMTSNLLLVQEQLGDRLGRDVFLYSITLKPTEDTPAMLRRYVEMQSVAPRWPFLTGAPKDVERIRRRLGFFDRDPIVDQDKTQHTGFVRIGNERLDRWSMAPALGKPDQITASILRLSAAG
ncbi:MAG: SCO family protein [Deltaproteobacteria bacterium]|nr:SCO family protein [Deltaproteobacteria bacterium]